MVYRYAAVFDLYEKCCTTIFFYTFNDKSACLLVAKIITVTNEKKTSTKTHYSFVIASIRIQHAAALDI